MLILYGMSSVAVLVKYTTVTSFAGVVVKRDKMRHRRGA